MTAGMNRRQVLKALGLGAAALALPRALDAAQSARKGPNIVYILCDDLGYGDPRCNNPDSKVPTPNIDRLAASGMRFTDAHSGSAVCTPTRYGILTGRYCWRTRLKKGVLEGYSPALIEPNRLTVPALLKQHGYRTACIGKWHLGLNWTPRDPAKPAAPQNVDFSKPVKGGPCDVGFDYYFGISASLDMPPYIFIENDRTLGLPTARGSRQEYLREGAREPDFHAVDVLPALTRKATEYIAQHAARHPEQPFFLYLPLTAPHTPVAPADFVKGKSKAGDYGDFVAEVDWTVGEVLKALEQHKLAEDTLVIFTSDNGSTNKPMTQFDHLPNGTLRGRKSTIWDGGHRIPFIARWPGQIAANTTSDQTLCLTDLLATAAALVGAPLPGDAGEDSFSILPALKGQKLDRPAVVHHSIDGMFALRQGRWKLVQGRGSGGWEGKGKPSDPEGQLYDMLADPVETTNLYTQRPEIVSQLSTLLEKFKTQGRSRG